MGFEALQGNLKHTKEIVREIYVFTNQLEQIKNLETGSNLAVESKEKKLLENTINSLTNQLRILNNSIPGLIQNIEFYQKLSYKEVKPIAKQAPRNKLVEVKYNPAPNQDVALTIGSSEKKEFLENLSNSNLSIMQLKKKYAVNKRSPEFGKPNAYAKISNRFFRNYSNKLISKGYFEVLNKNLRAINSPFVLGTYVSMIFFTMVIAFIAGIFLFILLLFFNLGLTLPFFSLVEEPILLRFSKVIWIIFILPIASGFLIYFFPSSESKNLGSKIDQELPFVTIHMSAIATSGVEPINIFKIILKSEEYRYTIIQFRKLMNLINFHGKDFVTALRTTAKSCPSPKLRTLLDGLATTATSGGSLHQFLSKHAETLLFDYKLEREKYTKASETFMDIYISIVIAAPMILLMLFVIMGSTGWGFMGLTVNILSLLIIFGIAILNIGFLIFLNLKQPAM